MNRRTLLRQAARGLALAAAPWAALAPRAALAAPFLRFDDPDFRDVVDPQARLVTLYAGGRWCEGPCYAPALGGLVFSDVRANRMMIIGDDGEVRSFRDPSDNANGNILDARERLVTCEHRGRRVVRAEADGSLTVLADRFGGKPLNAPNDAALAPDGAIWFTDPVFGISMPEEGIVRSPEQAARRVYRIDPDGTVTGRSEALDQPNGLAFSPDGRRLYVSDTGGSLNPEGARTINVFSVESGRTLGPPRVFATVDAGVPDGLAVDAGGRVYAACGDGVRVFRADGRLVGRIATAREAANVTFGGPDGRRLFIASGPAILAIDLEVRGAGRA